MSYLDLIWLTKDWSEKLQSSSSFSESKSILTILKIIIIKEKSNLKMEKFDYISGGQSISSYSNFEQQIPQKIPAKQIHDDKFLIRIFEQYA